MRYFGDTWKRIDFIGQSALIIYYSYDISRGMKDGTRINWIEYMQGLALGALLLGRAVNLLSVFPSHRFLISIIKRVVYDMKDFFLILLLSIIMFTIVFTKITNVAKRADSDFDGEFGVEDEGEIPDDFNAIELQGDDHDD